MEHEAVQYKEEEEEPMIMFKAEKKRLKKIKKAKKKERKEREKMGLLSYEESVIEEEEKEKLFPPGYAEWLLS